MVKMKVEEHAEYPTLAPLPQPIPSASHASAGFSFWPCACCLVFAVLRWHSSSLLSVSTFSFASSPRTCHTQRGRCAGEIKEGVCSNQRSYRKQSSTPMQASIGGREPSTPDPLESGEEQRQCFALLPSC